MEGTGRPWSEEYRQTLLPGELVLLLGYGVY